MEDRKNLPYTDAVIHETLRLSSIIPMSIPHQTSQDIVFRGHFIKKVRINIQLFIWPTIGLSVPPPAPSPVPPSVPPSTCSSLYPCVPPPVHLSTSYSTCPSIWLFNFNSTLFTEPIHLLLHLFLNPSSCFSINSSTYLSIQLFLQKPCRRSEITSPQYWSSFSWNFLDEREYIAFLEGLWFLHRELLYILSYILFFMTMKSGRSQASLTQPTS